MPISRGILAPGPWLVKMGGPYLAGGPVLRRGAFPLSRGRALWRIVSRMANIGFPTVSPDEVERESPQDSRG